MSLKIIEQVFEALGLWEAGRTRSALRRLAEAWREAEKMGLRDVAENITGIASVMYTRKMTPQMISVMVGLAEDVAKKCCQRIGGER